MVTVGRVVARKATALLVQALKAAARPNTHLLIVGDGPDAEPVRRAAAQAGLADQGALDGPGLRGAQISGARQRRYFCLGEPA